MSNKETNTKFDFKKVKSDDRVMLRCGSVHKVGEIMPTFFFLEHISDPFNEDGRWCGSLMEQAETGYREEPVDIIRNLSREKREGKPGMASLEEWFAWAEENNVGFQYKAGYLYVYTLDFIFENKNAIKAFEAAWEELNR